jgi:hypothetical protein
VQIGRILTVEPAAAEGEQQQLSLARFLRPEQVLGGRQVRLLLLLLILWLLLLPAAVVITVMQSQYCCTLLVHWCHSCTLLLQR